jgi:transposase-like protein
MITSAMHLYFTSESIRNVQKNLNLQGVEISHVAIYKWIGKYVSIIKEYLEEIKPNTFSV